MLYGTAAFNLGGCARLVSRTAGLPGEEPEAVGFPDSLATGFEVFAASGRAGRGAGWARVLAERRNRLGLTAVPLVALVAVVSASVVLALGGGHAHAEGGHDEHGHGTAEGETAAGHDEHGHDGAAAEGSDDFTATRIAASPDTCRSPGVDRIRQVNRDYLATQIRNRSRLLASLPEAEREERIKTFTEWTVDNALRRRTVLPAKATSPRCTCTARRYGRTLDNPADLLKLQGELQVAGTVIAAMPTAADAMAAGYMQVTPYVPGIGAHYLNIGRLLDDTFKPGEPEMLLTTATSRPRCWSASAMP